MREVLKAKSRKSRKQKNVTPKGDLKTEYSSYGEGGQDAYVNSAGLGIINKPRNVSLTAQIEIGA